MSGFIQDISNFNVLIGCFSGLAGVIGILFGVARYIIKKVNKMLDSKVKEPILTEIEENKKEYKNELDKHILQDYKTYLVDFLSDAEQGKPILKNQMKNAYDLKDEYNARHGNSYVDDKWDELEEKGIIKDLRKKERRVS